MKILVCGGLDTSLTNFRGDLIQSMISLGHEVIACAPNVSEAVRKELRAYGAEVVSVDMTRTGMNPFRDLFYLAQLRKLIKRSKPDKLLLYTIKPVIYGSLAARVSRHVDVYQLITGLGSTFMATRIKDKLLSGLVKRLYRTALLKSDGIIFQNADDLEEFGRLKLYSKTVRTTIVNGSGVNTHHYKCSPIEQHPVFLLIARLIADKGIREYVAAAKKVKLAYPDARFLLAGWADANPSAISKRELQRWEDDGTVEYLGNLSDVRGALQQCSVYVLPSYREGLPRTVIEAMSTGRAIITTDVPGCRDTVVQGVNGYLVKAKSVDDLAEAMARLANNSKLTVEMGDGSRRIAERKYDVNLVNEAMLSFLGVA